MPLISIVPSLPSERVIQFVAVDTGDILLSMERGGCRQGDIYRDGAYLTSAWHARTDVWALYQRSDAVKILSNDQGLRVVGGAFASRQPGVSANACSEDSTVSLTEITQTA